MYTPADGLSTPPGGLGHSAPVGFSAVGEDWPQSPLSIASKALPSVASVGIIRQIIGFNTTQSVSIRWFVDKMRSPCRGEVGHAHVVRPSDPAAPALRRHHVRCGGIELRWLASPACGNMEPPIHRARCAWDRPLGRGRVACVQRVLRSNSATVMDGISELLQ